MTLLLHRKDQKITRERDVERTAHPSDICATHHTDNAAISQIGLGVIRAQRVSKSKESSLIQ